MKLHTFRPVQEIDYRYALLQQCERVSCIIGASKKFRIDLETLAFNYTCKQPNQVGFTPLYIPTLIQYR